jgi:hypothetical protein
MNNEGMLFILQLRQHCEARGTHIQFTYPRQERRLRCVQLPRHNVERICFQGILFFLM